MVESESQSKEQLENTPQQELKDKLKSKMKKGYFQMGKINLELAEEGIKADKKVYEST
ncbi:hypothetical protein [Fuchsiella alkaliacetigena]|uniref:hypothetical protein n=1 Tax=Fuchsiella alkaliacetigena TaxID=957042 RepID=UPI00200AEDDB|nr:hypothetical protein [Fuchsiella alkaliacetigena]MCK8824124.1 hypothetical protein [Fuchsiella alkaliacetigena]